MRRLLQRRRRGLMKSNRPASVAPEAAAYHGVLPEGRWCEGVSEGFARCAVAVPKAWTTKELVPAAVVMFTDVGVKAEVEIMLSLLTALKVTEPVKPLTGVMVKVSPDEVAPGSTDTPAFAFTQGVMTKSALLPETKSTDAYDPFG